MLLPMLLSLLKCFLLSEVVSKLFGLITEVQILFRKYFTSTFLDQISQAYTGTIALKSDFTRTGKRNIQGLLNDAQNSLSRMYQNQFKDGFRQATIDFFLGNRDYSTMHEFENEEYNNFE